MPTVACCDERAALAGVRAGLPLTRALALEPALHADTLNAPRDHRTLHRLALRLQGAASPHAPRARVAIDPWRPENPAPDATDPTAEREPLHDGLVLDITGASDEAALCAALHALLARLRLGARVGVASTLGLAWALARRGALPTTIVPARTGEPAPTRPDAGVLDAVPVAGLRIGAPLESALAALGLRTAGDLLAMSASDPRRAALTPETIETLAWRLDQLAGRAPDALDTLPPVLPPEDLAPPARGRRGRRVEPRTGTAPTRNDDGRDLVAALSARFGSERVAFRRAVASHAPERALDVRPAAAPAPAAEAAVARVMTEHHAALDRPSVLFDEPEPARAIALRPGQPPTRLLWRGEDLTIVESAPGPERVATRAVGGRTLVRDYFRVRDQRGRWLWVFRETPPSPARDPGAARPSAHTRTPPPARWYVHGLWA